MTALQDDLLEAKLAAMPALRATSLRHVRPVVPLRFPSEEPLDEHTGQSKRHLELCAALYQMIGRVVGKDDARGADQFVYFDAVNPRRCLAPDAFVKRGVKDSSFGVWKTWERGAPDVAFELLSPSDTPERWSFREKLRRYRALGVSELIIANLDAAPGKRLRAWDRIDDDLVERVVKDDSTRCMTLGVHVLIGRVGEYAAGVRLAYDVAGTRPVLTLAEGERAATARVAELERELKKKKRKK